MDILEQSLETSNDEITLKAELIDDPKPISSNDLTIIDDEGSMSDDQGVDSLSHARALLDGDEDVQLHWKGDNGVTYRVFQVNHDDVEDEVVSSEFQSSSSSHTQPVAAVLTSNLASNHFYVVGNDVLASQTQRSLAPRSNIVLEGRPASVPGIQSNSTRVRRDDRRRATHNEVERRRRDKINNWILKLSKIIPDCNSVDSCKSVQSKGGILAKACDYILDLRNSNIKLSECLRENERLQTHIEYLMHQNEKLKVENAALRGSSGESMERSATDS